MKALAVPMAALMVSAAAQAQVQATQPAVTQPLWELGVGLGGVRLPHYRGSDQYHDYLLPVPYAVYRGDVLRATREGARAVLFETARVDFDLSVAFSAPTDSADNRARSGMPDLAPTFEIGPNLNWTLWRRGSTKLDLRLPARAVFTVQRDARAIGFTASPVVNLDLVAGGWNWGAQAGPIYGTRAFHAYWYDVSPTFATAARPAYNAGSGYAGWRWTVGTTRRLGPVWVGGFVRGDSIRGAVFEGSPLVKQAHSLSFGLALSWVLAVSDERVADHD